MNISLKGIYLFLFIIAAYLVVGFIEGLPTIENTMNTIAEHSTAIDSIEQFITVHVEIRQHAQFTFFLIEDVFMFIIGKEAQEQLRFLKRCSLCTHSTLDNNVVQCLERNKSALTVYRGLEPVGYVDKQGRTRRSPVRGQCEHFFQENAFS